MVLPSGNAAVAEARKYQACGLGLCLYYVQEWWKSGHAYRDAWAQWLATTQHRDRNAPPGAPVFYQGGKHGHVAISVGGGRMRSTDCTSAGKVDESDLDWPARKWGYKYVGWGGTLAGVTLPLGGGPAAAKDWASGDVYVDKLKYGQKDSDSVRRLQYQLNGVTLQGGQQLPVSGNYLGETDQEVRLWQKQVCGDPPDPPLKSSLGPKQAAKMFPQPPYVLH